MTNSTTLDTSASSTSSTASDEEPGPAWVMITANEGSARCEGCLVRNNLATAISVDKTQGITVDHNLIIKNGARLFVDAAGYDLHLKKGSRAVNAGTADMAPEIDIERVPRPWDHGYDIGAYEYHEGDLVPVPLAGPSAGGGGETTETAEQSTGRDCGNVGIWALAVLLVSSIAIGWLRRH